MEKATNPCASVSIDFAGSSPQVRGPVNCSLAVTATGAFVALKALLDPQGHINQGAFKPVTVSAPEGTVTNAQFPAAVGGFSEMRRRIESLVMGALAAAAPTYVAGDHKGASNHTYISNEDSERRRTTIFYEYPAGGTGGFLEHDGADAMRAWDEGDFSSIQPAEVVEHEHALLVECCELRTDSGGGGVHRGGLGLRRVVRLLANEGTFSELSDRNILQPFGVCGGGAGEPNRFVVLRNGIEIEPSDIPGKVSGFPLRRDDAVLMESAGGGGYGDALERLTSRVARDVREGYVSRR
ncbi:MAG: hydantoinase B/oxoprolinase family protein, partial [Pseudomonadota bacterium]